MSTETPTRLPKINHALVATHPTAPKVTKFFDPDLTPGQRRVLTAELPRLFRMLNGPDEHGVGPRNPGRTLAVVELLVDLAGQAPEVDAVIAAEAARRRETAAARPTLALALGQNRKA